MGEKRRREKRRGEKRRGGIEVEETEVEERGGERGGEVVLVVLVEGGNTFEDPASKRSREPRQRRASAPSA